MKANTKKLMAVILASFVVLSIASVAAVESVNKNIDSLSGILVDVDIENSDEVYNAVKSYLPVSYEETESSLQNVLTRRFILWTHDGVHVMWGKYGRYVFVGEDNEGVKVWGIYHKGFFAGFYGDKFFHGRYNNHRWRAVGLFGENFSYGGFLTFPRSNSFDVTPIVASIPIRQNLLSVTN